jgi:hypothetical protein
LEVERSVHGSGAPIARSRSARAVWNWSIASSDRSLTSRVACSAVSKGTDASLSELIRVLGKLLDLLRLRNDLVTIAEEQLPLRLRALRRGRHFALDAQQSGLTLGHELVERRLLDEHAGTMRGEQRECDGGAGAPAVGKFRFRPGGSA